MLGGNVRLGGHRLCDVSVMKQIAHYIWHNRKIGSRETASEINTNLEKKNE
jgi:hypothetical protein